MRAAIALVLAAVATPAVAAPRTFALMSDAARDQAAHKLAASFPSGAHAKATVDAAGFADEVELDVDSPIDDDHAVARIVELVAAHADAFGVTDVTHLHGHREYADVTVGQGERWTGGLEAHYEGKHVVIRGHLWPIDTPVAPNVDRAKLLAPYVGLKGKAPSRCCRDHDDIVTRADQFRVDVAVALVCKHRALEPRLAIALTAELGSATVPGLAKMPRLLDARTRERIDADFWMPPYGTRDQYPREQGTVQAYNSAACFYARSP